MAKYNLPFMLHAFEEHIQGDHGENDYETRAKTVLLRSIRLRIHLNYNY